MSNTRLTKREFLKTAAGVTAVTAAASKAPIVLAEEPKTATKETATMTTEFKEAPVVGCRRVGPDYQGPKAKVYFSKRIDPETLIRLYGLINGDIRGKTAIKLHTGERKGPNILPRLMVQAFQSTVPDSVIVETNTLYEGDRYTTEQHKKTLEINGWNFCPVDIMDEEGTVDLPVKGGKHFKAVSMGGHIVNYESMIVLTHFKGHAMGGFGGSMKNIAIGCADGRIGKAQVHAVKDTSAPWSEWPAKELLMENMAESAKAVCDHFAPHITFINVMRRMSVDCDCAGLAAAEPTIPDIGIVASTDILAVDQASVDHDLVERIVSRHGLRQLSYMAELGMGAPAYELIDIDEA